MDSGFNENYMQADKSEEPHLSENEIRAVFTEGLDEKQEKDFMDVAYERYNNILNKEGLNKTDRLIIINVFWSLVIDFFQSRPDEFGRRDFDEIRPPSSLKEKMATNSEWALNFIKSISSWSIDMDEIVELKKGLSPEEERFFWQIFHIKFPRYTNRSFEDFPNSTKKIISDIIEEVLQTNLGSKLVQVLDVGCGPKGNAINQLKEMYGNKINAFGINMEIYDDNKLADGVVLKEGDVRSMPFDENIFDLVYEIAVGGYFRNKEDLKLLINEAMRVLRRGGKLLLTDIEISPELLKELPRHYKIEKPNPKSSETIIIKQ